MEESDKDGDSPQKIGKKKYYPFGTPSHQTHAFSEFAHLSVDNRDFAKNLAIATDIVPEVIEIKKKVYRKPIPASELSEDANNDSDGGNGNCNKIACISVVRAISEMQYKNYNERLELEDEYERLVDELRNSEHEVIATESKLVKMNEIGNQLENQLSQLKVKVDKLEKTKDNLNTDRIDTSNKIMVMESERQKSQRKLEQTEKSLADAMWRKKKQNDEANNFQPSSSEYSNMEISSISESNIIHSDPNKIQQGNQVSSTEYNKMGRVDVVDYNESPSKVITLPTYLSEKLTNEPYNFDKYSKAFYYELIRKSTTSMKSSFDDPLAYKPPTPIYRTIMSRGSPRMQQSSSLSTLPSFDKKAVSSSVSSNKSMRASSSTSILSAALEEEAQETAVWPKVHVSSTIARLRMGDILRNRSDIMLSELAATLPRSPSPSSKQPEKSQSMDTWGRASSTASSSSRKTFRSNKRSQQHKSSIRLSPMDRKEDEVLRGEGGRILIGEAGMEDEQTTELGGGLRSGSIDTLSASLHAIFLRDQARSSWGRASLVGRMRIAEYIPLHVNHGSHYDTSNLSSNEALAAMSGPDGRHLIHKLSRSSLGSHQDDNSSEGGHAPDGLSGGGRRNKHLSADHPALRSRTLTNHDLNFRTRMKSQ